MKLKWYDIFQKYDWIWKKKEMIEYDERKMEEKKR